MRNILNKRPSVASVLALIALFAALGGTSYAAATISGKQVKNGTLTGKDIKNNSVGGLDVKESKLGQVPRSAKALQADQAAKATQADQATQADKASSADNATQAQKALTADQATKASSADAVGPNGVDSPAIQNGAVKGSKFGTITKRSAEVTITDNHSEFKTIACQAGERALGGGAYWNDVALNDTTGAQLHLVYSGATTNGWQARGYNNTGDNNAKLEVSVYCVN